MTFYRHYPKLPVTKDWTIIKGPLYYYIIHNTNNCKRIWSLPVPGIIWYCNNCKKEVPEVVRKYISLLTL